MTQTMERTMHAAAIDSFGAPITPHTLPVPKIDADEILMRVESAGVGVWDTFEREGGFAKMYGGKSHFPYVLGSDGAGTVMEVGTKVRNFKKGDKVYAFGLMNPKGGFYAQYAAVKANQASKIPNTLPVDQAGALPFDAMTALRGLDDSLGLKPGQTVMIFGASGGIGHLAVQLAKRMEARVFAVASGDDGVALAQRLGADTVVDGRKDDVVAEAKAFAPAGLDAALLTAGGKAAEQALTALRKGGRLAYPHGVEPEPKVRPDIKVKAYDGTPSPEAIKRLNQLIEKAPFEVHMARTFDLDHAAEAHLALEEHYLGKIALRPA